MKNFYKYFLILFVSLAVYSCKKQKPIIVYGSSKCHHCTHFLSQLDSAHMVYEFRDFMDADKKYDEEMLKKLETIGYRDFIHLPVVEVDGKFFVKAEFVDVYKEAYSN